MKSNSSAVIEDAARIEIESGDYKYIIGFILYTSVPGFGLRRRPLNATSWEWWGENGWTPGKLNAIRFPNSQTAYEILNKQIRKENI